MRRQLPWSIRLASVWVAEWKGGWKVRTLSAPAVDLVAFELGSRVVEGANATPDPAVDLVGFKSSRVVKFVSWSDCGVLLSTGGVWMHA